MGTLKDMVKNQTARFSHFVDSQLWYKTDEGFEFPVPLKDVGTTLFVAEYKAIRLMKWIRKHLEMIETEKEKMRLENKRTPCDGVCHECDELKC